MNFDTFDGCCHIEMVGSFIKKKKKVCKYSFTFLNEFTAATLISPWDLLSAHF